MRLICGVSTGAISGYMRRSQWWLRLGLLAIIALFAIPTSPVSAAVQAEALINIYSEKCLDVVGASTADGANVQQFQCHLGANQQWKIIPNIGSTYEPDGTYLIINQNSSKCLDVVG